MNRERPDLILIAGGVGSTGCGQCTWQPKAKLLRQHRASGETINYPGRDRLPPPTQLNDILKGTIASRVTTWGDKRDVRIDPSQIRSP